MTEQASPAGSYDVPSVGSPPRGSRRDASDSGMPSIDMSVPNVARIYDYLLGGKDNFACDKRAARQLVRLVPEAAQVAGDNRSFLQRAVKFLAAEAGIRQFIDIGTGLPTRGSVHEIAQRWRRDARVLYVDNDPVVVVHAQTLLADNRTAVAINRDLRQPRAVLDHPALQALINLDEPVAVLLVAILHFITNDESPHDIVNEIMEAMPTGSYLVISHGTAEHVDEGIRKKIRKLYDQSSALSARSRVEIERLFRGCDVIEPGIVSVSAWRNGLIASQESRVLCYAGVGKKL
jgi:hypothetical protein